MMKLNVLINPAPFCGVLKRGWIKTVCFAFCILVPVSCSDREPPKTKSARLPTVTVTKPKEERVERIITAVGTLEPEDEVQVATEVAGLVKEVKFKEGQTVNQGDILARIRHIKRRNRWTKLLECLII